MGKTRSKKYAIDGSTLNFGSCHVLYRGWKGTINQANAFLSRTWQAVPDFKNAGSTIVYGIAPGVKLNFYPGEGIFSLTGKNEIRDRYLPQIQEWLNGNPSSPLPKCDQPSLNSKTGQQIKNPSTYASPTKLSAQKNMTLLEASQHIINTACQVEIKNEETEENAPPVVPEEERVPPRTAPHNDEPEGLWERASTTCFLEIFSKMKHNLSLIITPHILAVFSMLKEVHGKYDEDTQLWIQDYTSTKMLDIAPKHRKWICTNANDWANMLATIKHNIRLMNAPNLQPKHIIHLLLKDKIEDINKRTKMSEHSSSGLAARVSELERRLDQGQGDLERVEGNVTKIRDDLMHDFTSLDNRIWQLEDLKMDGILDRVEGTERSVAASEDNARIAVQEANAAVARAQDCERTITALKRSIDTLEQASAKAERRYTKNKMKECIRAEMRGDRGHHKERVCKLESPESAEDSSDSVGAKPPAKEEKSSKANSEKDNKNARPNKYSKAEPLNRSKQAPPTSPSRLTPSHSKESSSPPSKRFKVGEKGADRGRNARFGDAVKRHETSNENIPTKRAKEGSALKEEAKAYAFEGKVNLLLRALVPSCDASTAEKAAKKMASWPRPGANIDEKGIHMFLKRTIMMDETDGSIATAAIHKAYLNIYEGNASN